MTILHLPAVAVVGQRVAHRRVAFGVAADRLQRRRDVDGLDAHARCRRECARARAVVPTNRARAGSGRTRAPDRARARPAPRRPNCRCRRKSRRRARACAAAREVASRSQSRCARPRSHGRCRGHPNRVPHGIAHRIVSIVVPFRRCASTTRMAPCSSCSGRTSCHSPDALQTGARCRCPGPGRLRTPASRPG